MRRRLDSAAPDFSLPDANGKTHSLSQYKGKYVVLEWFNPQCPFVKKHYGSSNMQNLQKEFTDKGVVWLTIDSNAPGTEGNLTPEDAQKIATSWKTHETALLLDPEGNAGRAYGAKNTPNMVIINPEGKIIYRGAIDSKATPNPSDIPSSTNYVKAALDQSLSGKSVAHQRRSRTVARLNTNPRRIPALAGFESFKAAVRMRPPLFFCTFWSAALLRRF